MSENFPTLSKSRFLAGLQCPLRLWYQCYNREFASPITPMQRALFESGHKIGQMATKRYAGGILIKDDYMHHGAAIQSTLEAMKNSNVRAIFEAAYMEDDVRIRTDILERQPERRWNLIEVKSSTKVKEENMTDVAVQYHVLKRAGIDLERIYLMHIDRDYIFNGEQLDLNQFLVLENLTADAIRIQDFVRENLDNLKTMLSKSFPPPIQPSHHCRKPYLCEFWDHCTRNEPENWIFELSGIRQKRFEELAEEKIRTIDEIPNTFPLTMIQQRIRNCILESREYVSPKLNATLSQVKYPLHFLDFETVMPAIPRYAGTRPYQTIPFQWSDHILYPDGGIEHRDFLYNEDRDPRVDFTQSLLDVLGNEGTIFIYTTYEKWILRELSDQLTQYEDNLNLLYRRFVDLCAIIKDYYYNPAFHGSFSLKNVLPALVPEMNYKNMAIQEGGMASLEYLRMIDPKTKVADKAEIRNNLLAYCGQDTLAMVKIRKVLLEKRQNQSGLSNDHRMN